jgi:hypothetical protein
METAFLPTPAPELFVEGRQTRNLRLAPSRRQDDVAPHWAMVSAWLVPATYGIDAQGRKGIWKAVRAELQARERRLLRLSALIFVSRHGPCFHPR